MRSLPTSETQSEGARMATAASAGRRAAGRVRRPARERDAIPFAGTAVFRAESRRTTIVRLALAFSLVVLLAVAVWRATRLEPQSVAFLPGGGSVVLALDVSKSVYVDAYRPIAAALKAVAGADASIGVVAFSDTAYEMVPPTARGSDLRPLIRFFTPKRGASEQLDPEARFPTSPWVDTFSSGTRISAGIALAHAALARNNVERGTILLVSDLETAPDDVPALSALVGELRKSEIELRVVGLAPSSHARALFGGLLEPGEFEMLSDATREPATDERRGRLPVGLVMLGALLLAAVAGHELLGGRLMITRASGAVHEPA